MTHEGSAGHVQEPTQIQEQPKHDNKCRAHPATMHRIPEVADVDHPDQHTDDCDALQQATRSLSRGPPAGAH